MKTNLGSADRIIRFILAAVITVLYFTNMISGTLAAIFLVVGVLLILTSFAGFCPLYSLLGIKTSKKPL